MKELDRIFASDLPDIEKLAQAFGRLTEFIIDHATKEIELAQAMQDQEAKVKAQIKMSTINHARSIFDDCYQQITREKQNDTD